MVDVNATGPVVVVKATESSSTEPFWVVSALTKAAAGCWLSNACPAGDFKNSCNKIYRVVISCKNFNCSCCYNKNKEHKFTSLICVNIEILIIL
jgi:hypothetical protein